MTILPLIVFVAAEARANCEDLAETVSAVERAVLDVKLSAAGDALQQAQAALACSPPATPPQLARLWLAEAVLAQLEGRSERAKEAFVAAWRAAPDLWVETYGPSMQALRNQAVLELGARPTGTLTLNPEPRVWSVWLDGRPATPPLTVSAGLHLVQLAPASGPAAFTKTFVQPAGEALTITVDVAEPSATPAAAASAPIATAAEPDPERVQDASTELQRRASNDWGEIDAATKDTSDRAERLLRRYLARYEAASASVDGQEIHVEISQTREARARLDALPEARAREAALAAEEESLHRSLQAPGGSSPRLDGVSLTAAAAAVRARTGEISSSLPAFGGIGPALTLSSGLHLGPRVALVGRLSGVAVFDRSEVPDQDPATGWTVEAGTSKFSAVSGELGVRLNRDALSLTAGPYFELGSARALGTTTAILPNDEGEATEFTVREVKEASLRVGGVGVSGRYLLAGSDRLRMGPELSVRVGSDLDRLYSGVALGLTLVMPGRAATP